MTGTTKEDGSIVGEEDSNKDGTKALSYTGCSQPTSCCSIRNAMLMTERPMSCERPDAPTPYVSQKEMDDAGDEEEEQYHNNNAAAAAEEFAEA